MCLIAPKMSRLPHTISFGQIANSFKQPSPKAFASSIDFYEQNTVMRSFGVRDVDAFPQLQYQAYTEMSGRICEQLRNFAVCQHEFMPRASYTSLFIRLIF